MSRGPADDDDLSIEITPDIIEGSVESGPTAVVAPRPRSFTEAANLDAGAEAQLYLAEAGLADAARVAPHFYEAGHLQRGALDALPAALASFQAALAHDPAFTASFAPLRSLLRGRASWDQLVAVYDRLIRAGASGEGVRRSRRLADLWIERGRIHEQRLARADEAAASYREAAVAAPEYAAAHLARLLGAAGAGRMDDVEAALAGLVDCAAAPERRVALAAELARIQRLAAAAPPPREGALSSLWLSRALGPRASDALTPGPVDSAEPAGPSGDFAAADRALMTLRSTLAGLDGRSTPAGIVSELEQLARLRDFPRAQAGAIEELARRLPPEASAAKVALHRERARVLRDAIGDLPAAHAALDDARRLVPEHPLLTTEMLDVADELGSTALLARTLETSAIPQDELQSAARLVDALARAGRAAEALDLVRKYGDSWTADSSSPVALAGLASRIALFAEIGDAFGLADAFEVEGERAQGVAAAHALVRAATLRDLVLHDPRHAESLYRKALDRRPGCVAAVDALEEMLRSDGRWSDLAQLWQDDLAALGADPSADASGGRRRYLLQALIVVHRDRLGSPARALEFQRQWLALEPADLDGWVAKRDLELAVSLLDVGAGAAAVQKKEGVATLIELAMRAGTPSVTAALENEAATLVSDDPTLAERFFRDAAADDRTGIAAGNLEPRFASAAERRKALATELAAAQGAGMLEASRALRHRLAAEHAAAGAWREAIAVMAPLRSAGDEVARAASFDRARWSGDAVLEVAVLTDAAGPGAAAPPAGLVAPADLGEALERVGNGEAAQTAFREALRRGRSTDAALGLLRTATAAGNLAGVSEALRAVGDMSFDDSGATVAVAATREAYLLDGVRAEGDVRPARPAGEPDAEDAMLDWIAGLRAGDPQRVAGALIELGTACAASGASSGPSAQAALLARASARSRLAGQDAAETIHHRAWFAAPGNPLVAHGISDVRAGSSSREETHLPDTRADRAAHLPLGASGLATELDLERALEQEAAGDLGEALDAYGRILGRDPDCLEAMLGVRRLARAGGDLLGEARALVRVGALVKTAAQAGALFAEAAPLYLRAGRREDAVAAYLKVLEHLPDDQQGYRDLADLLRAHLAAPGSAKTLDRVLSHRLHRRGAVAEAPEVIALLAERATNRLIRLEDRESAVEDFKRILKIDPRNQDALRQLATLAIAMQHPADAARFLERYLQVSADATEAAAARLELAQAYEDVGDRTRAIEVLRGAAAARPRETVPLARLTDLHLRARDGRNAIASLRAWEALVGDPVAKAELQLRIGTLLRDDAYDLPQAAVAFRCAADLDPLGGGTRELARLQESAGDEAGRVGVMERAIGDMRRALEPDPFHLPRLRRLKELLDGVWRDRRGREASRAVAQVLSLLGEPIAESELTPPAPRALAPALSNGFWTALADPGALGFLTEVWLSLADAILQLRPADAAGLGAVRPNRLAASDEPRIAWVIDTAAVLGIPALALHRVSRETLRDEEMVEALELPAPALVFGEAALAGTGEAPFWFGRALGLLRYRATSITRISGDALQTAFLAAGIIAGASPAGMEGSEGVVSDAQVKALSKALARKERKALALQASRFGFERIDAAVWQRAILRTADRLGLVLGGDVRSAVGALGGFVAPVAVSELRRNEAVVDLVRFSLGESYLALRKESAGRI